MYRAHTIALGTIVALMTQWWPTQVLVAQTTPYDSLLADQRVSSSLRWYQDGSTDTTSYDDWSEAKKAYLSDLLADMAAGNPFPLTAPPDLTDNLNLSRQDAWTLYALRIAHSLWVEAENMVGWSVLDFDDEELALLYDGTRMYSCDTSECGADYASFGRVTDWNPRFSYDFLLDNGMVRPTQLATVYAFTYWGRKNLSHISGVDDNPEGHERLYGYRGDPPVDKVLVPLPDQRYITAGCWGTSGLFNAVLRSVNIPVETTTTYLGTPNNDWRALHSRFQLPTLDLGLTHGDDVYNDWLIPSKTNRVHTAFLFHSLEWLKDYVDDPQFLDCNQDLCNPPEDQAAFNSQRHALEVAIAYFSDALLRRRTDEGTETEVTEQFRQALIGVGVDNGVFPYAHSYFTESEIDDIVRRIDDEIRRIGNGSWDDGRAEILFSPDLTESQESGVTEYPPFASFAAVPGQSQALQPIQFKDYPIGDIATYLWDFGDGETSSETDPSHTFTFVDSLSVTLTVTGPSGTTTSRRTVYIAPVEGVNAPTDVSVAGPADAATGLSLPVELNWESLQAARRYDVQIATDEAFTQVAAEARRVSDVRVTIDGLSTGAMYYWRVRARNEGGVGPWSATRSFTTSVGTAVEGTASIPGKFALHFPYPNPFNRSTTIVYDLPEAGFVELTIFDALGRVVESLVRGPWSPGKHTVTWLAEDVQTGVYFVRMEAGAFSSTKRMLVLR